MYLFNPKPRFLCLDLLHNFSTLVSVVRIKVRREMGSRVWEGGVGVAVKVMFYTLGSGKDMVLGSRPYL